MICGVGLHLAGRVDLTVLLGRSWGRASSAPIPRHREFVGRRWQVYVGWNPKRLVVHRELRVFTDRP